MTEPANATAASIKGVLAPVVTPFTKDLSPDVRLFVQHCTWLLTHGCSGLAVFGTNSEANSMSVGERLALLDALVDANVPASRLMPGTGCSAMPDTVRLTSRAVDLNCAGVLMLPPFFYKGVSEDGLYRSYSEIVQRVGSSRLRIYLYHIPAVTGVPITVALVERLLKAYPGTIAGIKDSSGDWQSAQAFLSASGQSGFDVFVGTETLLLQNLRAGGAGCISAGANINPHGIDAVYRGWQTTAADTLQARTDAVRKVIQSMPMIPALKAVVARHAGDAAWLTVRPPLTELSEAQRMSLLESLDALDFSMPDLV